MKTKAIISNHGADLRPVLCPINRDYCRKATGRLDRKCMYFESVTVENAATYYKGASVDVNCGETITDAEAEEMERKQIATDEMAAHENYEEAS